MPYFSIFGSTAAYRCGEGPNGTIRVGQGVVYSRPDIASVKVSLDNLKAEHQVLLVQVTMEEGQVVMKRSLIDKR